MRQSLGASSLQYSTVFRKTLLAGSLRCLRSPRCTGRAGCFRSAGSSRCPGCSWRPGGSGSARHTEGAVGKLRPALRAHRCSRLVFSAAFGAGLLHFNRRRSETHKLPPNKLEPPQNQLSNHYSPDKLPFTQALALLPGGTSETPHSGHAPNDVSNTHPHARHVVCGARESTNRSLSYFPHAPHCVQG